MPSLTKRITFLCSLFYILLSQQSSAQVNFGYEVITVNCADTVMFQDSTIADSGLNVISWAWDFGDGTNLSRIMNPSHEYINNGYFDVKLKVRFSDQSVDSIVRTIFFDGPIPGFYIVQQTGVEYDSFIICEGDMISIRNSISGKLIDPDIIINWGDGINSSYDSSFQTAEHQYTVPGSYRISMTLWDDLEGTNLRCFYSFPLESDELLQKKEIIIHVMPRRPADFIIATNPTFVGHPTGFEVELDPIYSRMTWDFGDGSDTVLNNVGSEVIHKYPNPGEYTVTLVPEYTPSVPFEPVCPDTVRKQILVHHDSLNSIVELNAEVSVLPNPSEESISVHFDKVYNSVDLELLNLKGEIVKVSKYSDVSFIDLNLDVVAGQYVLRVTLDHEKVIHKRLVKL